MIGILIGLKAKVVAISTGILLLLTLLFSVFKIVGNSAKKDMTIDDLEDENNMRKRINETSINNDVDDSLDRLYKNGLLRDSEKPNM